MNASTTAAPARPAIVQAIEAAIIATAAELAPVIALEIFRGLAADGHTELYVPKDKPRNRKREAVPLVEKMLAEGMNAKQIKARLKLSRTVTYEAIAEVKRAKAQTNATA